MVGMNGPKAWALPLLCGLGLAGLAAGAGQAASTGGPMRCEIRTESAGRMIVLQGMVHADSDVSGTYRFEVESRGNGGNSDISQGGSFTAGPDHPATLGRVMVAAAGAIYDVSLDVTSGGAKVSCSEQVGGKL